MTLQVRAVPVQYDGNGVTTEFSFPYRFFKNEDLVVKTLVEATGVEAEALLDYDYEVDGADDDAGGTVTFLVAPASGVRVTIYREIDLFQELDLIENDQNPAETREKALDKIVAMTQQIQNALERCAPLVDSDETPDPALYRIPLLVSRASKLFGWDSDGNPTPVSAGVNTAITTAFIETLLDDATAAVARNTLGFTGSGGTVPKALLDLPGALNLTEQTKVADYTMLNTDSIIFVSGLSAAFTLTLPDATVAGNIGRMIIIQRTETTLANAVTIARQGTDTIYDPSEPLTTVTSTKLHTIGETLVLIGRSGGVWQVVARHIPAIPISFTPTGAWSTNTTYTGIWTRRRNKVEIEVKIATAGAPTSATLTLNMPTGMAIATGSLIGGGLSADSSLGKVSVNDDGNATRSGRVQYSSSSAVRLMVSILSGGTDVVEAAITQAVPFTWGAADYLIARFEVPVSGWLG